MIEEEMLDHIFNYVDDLFFARKFQVVDEILNILKPIDMNLDLCLAYLTITLPASNFLPSRFKFFHLVKQAHGDNDDLLLGLE